MITITPPLPQGLLTPFAIVQVVSDFIGTVPDGTTWRITIYSSPEPGQGQDLYQITKGDVHSALGQFVIGPATDQQTFVNPEVVVRDETDVHVTVELVQPGNVVMDSGTVTGKWNSTAGFQLSPPLSIPGTGGLTEQQAQQLTEVHQSTALTQLLDRLTLIPLTTGPSAGPITRVLDENMWGVLIRIATIPLGVEPQTPDGDYWVKTLASVRLFRGSDIWQRYPIHTSSKIISFLGEPVVAAIPLLRTLQWLLDITLEVDFLPGVTGEVFLMRFG
jgi:hypothetical protein